jgi:Flp pilus assembly protein TadB
MIYNTLYKHGNKMRILMTILVSIIPTIILTVVLMTTEMNVGGFLTLILAMVFFYICFETQSRFKRADLGYGNFEKSLFGLPPRNEKADWEKLNKINKEEK